MRQGEEKIHFEINCTKAKWQPKTVSDIPRVVGNSFETDIKLRDIQPLIGTDHVKKWAIKKDSDIEEFMNAPSMLREAFAEKVIRFKLPDGLMPTPWQPKKVKILAKGERLSKYFGEDQVSTRQVEVSLKLFDCGHFYMKQTLPGSGISPHWVIFEGAWKHTDKGLHLQYLIRYSWQVSRKPEIDFSIECVPALSSTLAWAGDSETQLNGQIPAIVGEDAFCWIEIYRDADSTEKVRSRFNEDLDLEVNKEAKKEKLESKPEDPMPQAQPFRSRWEEPKKPSEVSPQESKLEKDPCWEPQATAEPMRPESKREANLHQRPASSSSSERQKPSPSAPSASKPAFREDAGPVVVDNEPIWPLLLGAAVFVLMMAFFGWLQWQERSVTGESSAQDGIL
mmetsp:Transcript_105938/g.187574  ORF Transcript_105938/g.187574 Transcript_105938/m.187574 type:complete len:395 (+) Transcript_105938:49-1233(+)